MQIENEEVKRKIELTSICDEYYKGRLNGCLIQGTGSAFHSKTVMVKHSRGGAGSTGTVIEKCHYVENSRKWFAHGKHLEVKATDMVVFWEHNFVSLIDLMKELRLRYLDFYTVPAKQTNFSSEQLEVREALSKMSLFEYNVNRNKDRHYALEAKISNFKERVKKENMFYAGINY